MVGVGVVPVVLAHPPPVADTGDRTVHVADQIVAPARGEDLPVAGIVPDERELGEHHREVHPGQQLPPGVAHNDEHGGSQHKQPDIGGDPPCVVPAAALQQPSRLDQA